MICNNMLLSTPLVSKVNMTQCLTHDLKEDMSEIAHFIDLLNDLKKKQHIKKRLDFFYDFEHEGWEKWLQMELLYAMNENWGADHYKEIQYDIDKRKSERSFSQLDLVYRRPKTTSDVFVGVELKVINEPNRCIKGSLADLQKFSKLKPSQWDFRAIIAMAVYLPEQRENSKALALAREHETLQFGPYEVAIISWETEPKNEFKFPGFRDWLAQQ